MSESRAKRERKEKIEPTKAKKKNGKNNLFNIIVVLVIVAVAGLGGYATYEKIKNTPAAEETATDTQSAETQMPETVADIATEEELSAEELLAKLGMEDSGLTGESTYDELTAIMTLENFAKFEDMDVTEFKKEYGIESISNDTLWTEAQMKIPMSKMAEKLYGVSFEEFAAQNGLPAEITADMTQEEALAVMESQAQQTEE